MAQFSVNHVLDVGILIISITEFSDIDNIFRSEDIFHFVLEKKDASAIFDADYTREELTEMCLILGESEELCATLEEPPSIKLLDKNTYLVTFIVIGRKRTYPVEIRLSRSLDERREMLEMHRKCITLQNSIGQLKNELSQKMRPSN